MQRMTKTLRVFLVAVALLLAACQGAEPLAATPTPFSVTPAVARITTAAPIPITLANLAANPDFFVGATLQLQGSFRRLPRQVCAGETWRSPATWGLEADGYLASAAGMDEQLRALLTEGQNITVEGQWLKFNGRVGCGVDAQEQEIWYLSVERVLEPNPLVSAPAQREPGTLPATAVAQVEPSPAAQETLPTAVPFTPTLPPTANAATLSGATVSPAPITATVPITVTSTPTATLFSAGTTPDTALTETPTATGSPTSVTPGTGTPSAGTATSTTVAPPANGTEVDQGTADFEDLLIAALPEGVTHSWNLDLAANSAITVSVAPAATANIVLSVLDPGGAALVSTQNQAPIGEAETITNLQITNPGIYRVLVTTSPAAATDYALMVMDSSSYSFDLRGTLRTNTVRSDSLAANHDHFWFFTAESGQSLSFTVTPQGPEDPYVELYDPGGARILTIDNTSGGDAEALEDYTLLASGMYGIRVAEFDFQPMSYQIVLSRP